MHFCSDVTMLELSRVWSSHGSYIRENVIRGFIEQLPVGWHEILEDVKEQILSHSTEIEDEIEKSIETSRETKLDSEIRCEGEYGDDDDYDNE